MEQIGMLVALARAGAYSGYVRLSTTELGEMLGISQQAVSRRLRQLEAQGYIVRDIHPRGQRVKLTPRGRRVISNLYAELRGIIGKAEAITISGKVCSGLGEGSYYMSLPGYLKQFEQKLGFTPYPGTLNLQLTTQEDVQLRQELAHLGGIVIEGFEHEGRRLGDVVCFRAEVGGYSAGVVIPARTHHTLTTLEVIAPVNLRRALGLRDGDVVQVKVYV